MEYDVSAFHHPDSATHRSFSDGAYLRQVIYQLREVRMNRGWSVERVARLAGVGEAVIKGAESCRQTPSCQQFKAWSAALALSWEDLWSDCLR